MSLFLQVLSDLVGMFIADARLTLAVLALVALLSALIRLGGFAPLPLGWILPLGAVLILLASAISAARRR